MSNRQFAERLNAELDEIELPQPFEERVDALAKLLHVPRFKAQSMLSGTPPSEQSLLDLLAQELEVSADWLLGKQNKK